MVLAVVMGAVVMVEAWVVEMGAVGMVEAWVVEMGAVGMVAEWVVEMEAMDLRKTLNIPENLTALGVKAADLDMLTDMALEDPSCGGNPREMTAQNTRALFDACM